MALQIKLNISEDEELRNEIKRHIAGAVRGVIREELGGIIASEVAKLRLTDPNSPLLTTLITNSITHQLNIQLTTDELRDARNGIRDKVRRAVKGRVDALATSAINTIMAE